MADVSLRRGDDGGNMDKLIIVSSDSHAGVPQDLWPEYLDKRFHHLLPRLHEDNKVYPTVIWLLTSRGAMTRPDVYEAHHTGGWKGLYDAKVRLTEMDREGVAAELIYHGDFRMGDMFHNVTNDVYPLDAWEAGARGFDRWAADNFGSALERFLVVGAIGPCVNMDSTLAELDWIADHGFVGTYLPGYLRHPDMPSLYDTSWEPFWAKCEDLGLALVVHAGYGWDQGVPFSEFKRIYSEAVEAAGSSELEDLLAHPEAINPKIFNGEFFADPKPRRPMWQLMFGGVFDRHPDLKLILTEIRADWIPATLGHLDAVYHEHRDELPARRPPSEYWHRNCLVGASFIHKAEVEMRHEIGVETISFGRDYPHPESTWPHTKEWLKAAFAGLPEAEVRQMLGGNAIRFLDLDRARLAAIAERIGPILDEVTMATDEVEPDLITHLDTRGGLLKPAEGGSRLSAIESIVKEDLVGAGASL
jgi:predicted TIM-barrel fold metal-dependent hydrolase